MQHLPLGHVQLSDGTLSLSLGRFHAELATLDQGGHFIEVTCTHL